MARQELAVSEAQIDRPHIIWWILVIGGMGTLAVLAFAPAAFAWWTTHLFPVPPQRALMPLFGAAVGLHAAEARYAYQLAERSGQGSLAGAWALQTFILGFPSLRLLRARAAQAKSA
jgi:hypothetical protein